MLARRLLLAAGGTGSFALPGGAPGGGPYDDEFDNAATLTSTWNEAAGDYGSTIVAEIDGVSHPGAFYLWGQRYRVAPSIPFTVTTYVEYVDWDTGPGVGGVWTVLAAGAPGPYTGFGVDVGTPGTMWLSGSRFDATGAFIENIPGGGYNPQPGYYYATPHYTRLTVTAGPTVKHEWSPDGLTWTTVSAAYALTHAVNYVGLESGGARAAWSWFRVT